MHRLVPAFLIVGLAASCIGADVKQDEKEDANQVVNSIFGAKIKKVAATRERDDDLALAKELLSTAGTSADQPALLTALCDKAYSMTITHPSGYATAAQAMRLLADNVEPQRAAARKKLVGVLTRQTRVGPAAQRTAAGKALVQLQTQIGDEQVKQNKSSEALITYRQALDIAARQKSPEADVLRAKIAAITRRALIEKQIDQLKTRLLKNPVDQDAITQIVNLYVIKLDNPKGALPYLKHFKDQAYAGNVALAAKLHTELNETEILKLGEWYNILADNSDDAIKHAMLNRTRRYFSRYLSLHSTADIVRKKAEVMLKLITEAWISKDATYKPSSQFRGIPPLPGLLTGGKGLHNDQGAFAFATGGGRPGAYVVIDLGKPKFVSRVWIKNRFPYEINRAAGLSMSFSNKKGARGTKFWTAENPEKDWEIKLIQPATVRYITLALPIEQQRRPPSGRGAGLRS